MTIDEVKELIQTFEDSSLTELVFSREDAKLTLRRRTGENPVYSQPIMVHPTAMPVAGVTGSAVGSEAGGGKNVGGAHTAGDVELITSPIVGTFYRSPAPDSPPFCEVGDVVEKGRALCILEAMKVMNELDAEFTMEIVGIRVNNGEMVEYGTPLLEVRRV